MSDIAEFIKVILLGVVSGVMLDLGVATVLSGALDVVAMTLPGLKVVSPEILSSVVGKSVLESQSSPVYPCWQRQVKDWSPSTQVPLLQSTP